MRRARLSSRLFFGALVLASGALASGRARADEVVLEDGQVVEGVVTTDARSVHVRLDYGTISFRRDEVKEIRKKDSALLELDRRRATLDARDPAAVRALAAWADDQGLDAQARALYRLLLGLEPDDAIARERLGYRQREGKWLTEDEYMSAEGFVRYEGVWKTRAEVELLEAARVARVAEASRRNAGKKAPVEESKDEDDEAGASTTSVTEGQTIILRSGGWGGWPRRGVRPRGRLKGNAPPAKVATPPKPVTPPAKKPSNKSGVRL